MEPNRTQRISVEVKKLFPKIREPVSFGQLTSIVEAGINMGCDSEAIQKTGLWWLSFKDLGITNMKSAQINRAIKKSALQAAQSRKPVHLVATRSPDFILHFVEHQEGEPTVSDRSMSVLKRVAEVRQLSQKFLPTRATVFLADIALANADDPNNKLSRSQTEELLSANLVSLIKAARLIDPDIDIARLGDVTTNGVTIRENTGLDGNDSLHRPVLPDAINKIVKVAEESTSFHSQLGWTQEDVFARTEKLAKCMGVVGQAFHAMTPKPIMLFMESFVKRADFNNIFNPQNDPLPIICFNDLQRSNIIQTDGQN